MFGYIRVCKPELRIKEFAEYKGVYCSICKYMGKVFGKITRLTLSYDSAFLAMLAVGVAEDVKIGFSLERCCVNPLKKCSFYDVPNHDAVAVASCASILLTHYKLCDDIEDSKFLKKAVAHLMLVFFRRSYKKAKVLLPEVDTIIAEQMRRQRSIEADPDACIDLCAEPSALIVSHIAEKLSSNEKQKIILKEFGYFLGRWICLIDAADDIEKDRRYGNFNVFINRFNLNTPTDSQIYDKIEPILNQTLGRLISTYNLLEIYNFKDVLDNIIYYGLNATQKKVLKKDESGVSERSI